MSGASCGRENRSGKNRGGGGRALVETTNEPRPLAPTDDNGMKFIGPWPTSGGSSGSPLCARRGAYETIIVTSKDPTCIHNNIGEAGCNVTQLRPLRCGLSFVGYLRQAKLRSISRNRVRVLSLF